jgi:hypothetical protein
MKRLKTQFNDLVDTSDLPNQEWQLVNMGEFLKGEDLGDLLDFDNVYMRSHIPNGEYLPYHIYYVKVSVDAGTIDPAHIVIKYQNTVAPLLKNVEFRIMFVNVEPVNGNINITLEQGNPLPLMFNIPTLTIGKCSGSDFTDVFSEINLYDNLVMIYLEDYLDWKNVFLIRLIFDGVGMCHTHIQPWSAV